MTPVDRSRARRGYMGSRLTASRVDGTRDYKITFSSGPNSTKNSKQPILLLGETRENAERALWRAQFINAHQGEYCRLWIYKRDGYEEVTDVDHIVGPARKEKAADSTTLPEYKTAKDNLKRIKRDIIAGKGEE